MAKIIQRRAAYQIARHGAYRSTPPHLPDHEQMRRHEQKSRHFVAHVRLVVSRRDKPGCNGDVGHGIGIEGQIAPLHTRLEARCAGPDLSEGDHLIVLRGLGLPDGLDVGHDVSPCRKCRDSSSLTRWMRVATALEERPVISPMATASMSSRYSSITWSSGGFNFRIRPWSRSSACAACAASSGDSALSKSASSSRLISLAARRRTRREMPTLCA